MKLDLLYCFRTFTFINFHFWFSQVMLMSEIKDKKNKINYGSVPTTEKFVHPSQSASLWSKTFMSWCDDLLKLGSQRQLNEQDAWPLMNDTTSETCTDELEAIWDGKSSLTMAFLNIYGLRYFMIGILLAGGMVL